MKSPSQNYRTFFLVILAVACAGIIATACGGGGGEVELFDENSHTRTPNSVQPRTPSLKKPQEISLPSASWRKSQTGPYPTPQWSGRPRTASPAESPTDPHKAIDKLLESMSNGNIAFNAPQSMILEDTDTIQLKLGLNAKISDLKRLIESEGAKEGFKIKVAERMEARLSGQNFAITAITPEVQAISRNEITSWSWEVKPKTKGKQYLHLTLTALISISGNSTPRTLRTFSKAVNVDVTQSQQLESFVSQNWQWLWATLLVPIAGWVWKSKTNKN
jgi:hypothetical protein